MKKDFQKWHNQKRYIEHERPRVAIISQIRLIDAKRLKYKMGNTTIADFAILKHNIRQLLA